MLHRQCIRGKECCNEKDDIFLNFRRIFKHLQEHAFYQIFLNNLNVPLKIPLKIQLKINLRMTNSQNWLQAITVKLRSTRILWRSPALFYSYFFHLRNRVECTTIHKIFNDSLIETSLFIYNNVFIYEIMSVVDSVWVFAPYRI